MNAHGCAHACHGTQSASASGSVVGGVHGAVSGNMTANSMRIRFGTVLRRGRANICALWFATSGHATQNSLFSQDSGQ